MSAIFSPRLDGILTVDPPHEVNQSIVPLSLCLPHSAGPLGEPRSEQHCRSHMRRALVRFTGLLITQVTDWIVVCQQRAFFLLIGWAVRAKSTLAYRAGTGGAAVAVAAVPRDQ